MCVCLQMTLRGLCPTVCAAVTWGADPSATPNHQNALLVTH
jgi:hypothetical protein